MRNVGSWCAFDWRGQLRGGDAHGRPMMAAMIKI
jgi:hypothetical protein